MSSGDSPRAQQATIAALTWSPNELSGIQMTEKARTTFRRSFLRGDRPGAAARRAPAAGGCGLPSPHAQHREEVARAAAAAAQAPGAEIAHAGPGRVKDLLKEIAADERPAWDPRPGRVDPPSPCHGRPVPGRCPLAFNLPARIPGGFLSATETPEPDGPAVGFGAISAAPVAYRTAAEPERSQLVGQRRVRLRLWWAWAGVLGAAAMILFLCYLGVSRTQPVVSDGASNALQAWDMLHGNWLLRGWTMSDVSFYTTELPEYVVVEAIRGLTPGVVHVAAAVTYTLLVLLAGVTAKGRATGWEAVVRVLIASGIMLAPQLGNPAFVQLLSPDHVGTAVPLLVIWLVMDRGPVGCGPPAALVSARRDRADAGLGDPC